jgi:hypothetical protein
MGAVLSSPPSIAPVGQEIFIEIKGLARRIPEYR